MGALEVARVAAGREGIGLRHRRHVAGIAPIIKPAPNRRGISATRPGLGRRRPRALSIAARPWDHGGRVADEEEPSR